MNRIRSMSTGAALAMMSLAATSFATTPLPIATMTGGVQLGGHTGGVVDPRAELRITLTNSVNQQPLVNSLVTVYFSACEAADLHLAATQPFHPAVHQFDCSNRTVTAISNIQGVATFRILGSASAVPGNSPGLSTGCAIIRADGIVLAVDVRVAAYDLDGRNGVNAADQSLLLGTLFAGPTGYRSRADYNGDGLVNSADLAKHMAVMFSAGSMESAAVPFCF